MVHRFQSNLSLSLVLYKAGRHLPLQCRFNSDAELYCCCLSRTNCFLRIVFCFSFAFLSFDLFLPFSSGGNLLVTLVSTLVTSASSLELSFAPACLPVCRHSFQFLCWLLCVQHFLHFHFPADAISNHCHNCLPLCPLLCFLLWNPRWCPLKKEASFFRDRYNHTSTCCCCYFISGLASYLLLLFFHFVIQRRRRQQQTSICSRKRLWHLSLSLLSPSVFYTLCRQRERGVSS